MGGGLAFLTKKSFNPANWSNQRQVWEARQKNETEKRRIAERQAQLKREREEEDLARVVGGEEEGGRKALGFMYEAGKVPGLERRKDDDDDDVEIGGIGGKKKAAEGSDSVFERQPGDDDAAAAFRAMLAMGAAPPAPAAQHSTVAGDQPSDGIEGDNNDANPDGDDEKDKNESRERDHRTNLEKAVGRGINNASGVTLAQQMERFPMLKGAPMVLQKPDGSGGDAKKGETPSTNVIGLNFKPLGQVLRNVQCLKCGVWGHARGDRECEVSGWNPFAAKAPPVAVAAPVVCLPVAAAKVETAVNNAPDFAPTKMAETEKSNVAHESSELKPKKEKRRHKEDRHRKKKRKHKRRRRRSPSYSSSGSDSSSSDSYDDREADDRRRRHRSHRHDDDSDDNSDGGDSRRHSHHRSRKDSSSRRHRSSSRRHEKSSSRRPKHHSRSRRSRSRSRSRSPCSK